VCSPVVWKIGVVAALQQCETFEISTSGGYLKEAASASI